MLRKGGKYTGDYVIAAKDAIATMSAALPEITIKDEENEFDSKEFKGEYEKIHRDAVEYLTLFSKRSMDYLCIIVIISKMA